jgi:hypothetical protein
MPQNLGRDNLETKISNKSVFTSVYFTCNTILGPSFRLPEQGKAGQKDAEKLQNRQSTNDVRFP